MNNVLKSRIINILDEIHYMPYDYVDEITEHQHDLLQVAEHALMKLYINLVNQRVNQ